MGTIITGTGLAASFVANLVQASDINDLTRALERERANEAVLLQGITQLNQELKQARGTVKHLGDELAREKLSSKKAKMLMEQAQAEAARFKAENATLHGDLGAKITEIESLKAKLEEAKKAA